MFVLLNELSVVDMAFLNIFFLRMYCKYLFHQRLVCETRQIRIQKLRVLGMFTKWGMWGVEGIEKNSAVYVHCVLKIA